MERRGWAFDGPSFGLALGAVALHGGALVLAARGTIPVPAAFPLCVLAGYLGFTPLHEAAHGNVARTPGRAARAIEAAIGVACAMLLVAPFPSFRALHLRHHRHPNDPRLDPDRWVAGEGALSIAARCFTILPRYYAAFLAPPAGTARQPLGATLATQACFAAILVAAALGGRLGLLLVLWPGAALVSTGLLAFAFDWLPHRPHASGERFHDARVILAPGLAVLTLGHNYHLVHHTWPQIPFHRYAGAFRARRAELTEAGARIDDYSSGSSRFGISTVDRSAATNTSGWIADASARNGSSEP